MLYHAMFHTLPLAHVQESHGIAVPAVPVMDEREHACTSVGYLLATV